MNLNDENINLFFNKYISYVDEISKELRYDSNIRHLLYVIVPAFIYKYKANNETLILDCFRKVKIYKSNHKEGIVTASFNRILKKENTSYYTDKYIVINNYSENTIPTLIDNIVHEFNSAINSINNEIKYDEKYIKVKTGLSNLIYDKSTMKFLKKSDEIALEEILNTSQTEEIINIINNFGKYNIENSELANMLYNLKIEIGDNGYISDAYAFQKSICKGLIDNKTFAPTINNLRFKGFIDEIPTMFDNVIGKNNSYKELNKILTEMHLLILKYSNRKIFKEHLLNKIMEKKKEVEYLINIYENNCIFK